MNKSAKSKDRRKAARGQLWLHLPGMVCEALYDTVIGAGLACVDEVLETERVALCGERYEHLADRQALRAGHVASSLVLGGRRVAVQRPRARSVAGRELRLPSWREWSARDPLEQRAVEQMVLGVSPRGYARIRTMLRTLEAALATLTESDIKGLFGWPEGETIEFKETLPSERGVDPWFTAGNISRYAQAAIFKEIVAFANSAGGRLFLGVQESEQRRICQEFRV